MSRNRQIGIEGGIKVVSDRKTVYRDFKDAKKWTKKIMSLHEGKKEKQNLSFSYTCSFKVPNNPDEMSDYMQEAAFATTLDYEKRLSFEIEKAEIWLHVSYMGLSISGKLPNGTYPEKVMSMIREVVKVRMLIEFELHGNEEIKASIPPLDEKKVDVELINREIEDVRNQIVYDEDNFDVDEILDKIYKSGISSITQDELDFLNQQSRRL